MKKEEILTYLAPSQICDSVGVFAYIDIPKDTIIFPEIESAYEDGQRSWSTVTKEAAKKIKSLTIWDENGFWSDVNINRFDISYYVNHSRKPNVHLDRMTFELYAIRNIKEGKELLQYYAPYERDW